MIWLQLTANTGPAECCLGVKKALVALSAEAEALAIAVRLIDTVDGPVPGTLRSVLVELDDAGSGSDAVAFSQRWCGTLLWVCESSYRPLHKRKNWFLSGAAFAPPELAPDCGGIRYEAMRASGAGGQHVNKTDSAIRATHVASGLTVKVQAERSQHANKRLAGRLLASKLAALAQEQEGASKSQRRDQHWDAERGNSVRAFVGMRFVEKPA